MKIEIKILDGELYSKTVTPTYSTEGSAAIDLVCAETTKLYGGETRLLRTGIAIHIGSSYSNVAGLIMPRSGLGTRGLVLANTIGLIDEDYQGELLISAWNRSTDFCVIDINRGDRIAQLMFVPIVKPEFTVVEDFNSKTQRGSLGLGSTGV